MSTVPQAPFDARRDPVVGGRHGLVGRTLATAMRRTAGRRVLDCGGGSGAFAVPLAASGAEVTVVDISADALAILQRRADDAGVSRSVHALAGDVDALAELVPAASFDAVLAHGILDVIDRPEAGLAAMAAAVRPGGVISVLVANPVAAVLARALAGDPVAALHELRHLDQRRRITPDAVADLAVESGLVVEARYGIGVFSDLVPGAAGDQPGGREAVAALDAEVADRAPFADIAGRVQLLLRRPTG